MKDIAEAITELGDKLKEAFKHFERPVLMVSPVFRNYLERRISPQFANMNGITKLFGIEVANMDDFDWCIAISYGRKIKIPTLEEMMKEN